MVLELIISQFSVLFIISTIGNVLRISPLLLFSLSLYFHNLDFLPLFTLETDFLMFSANKGAFDRSRN